MKGTLLLKGVVGLVLKEDGFGSEGIRILLDRKVEI